MKKFRLFRFLYCEKRARIERSIGKVPREILKISRRGYHRRIVAAVFHLGIVESHASLFAKLRERRPQMRVGSDASRKCERMKLRMALKRHIELDYGRIYRRRNEACRHILAAYLFPFLRSGIEIIEHGGLDSRE